MTQPLQIQLAVQGGGAKIAALIAAMTAIEELEKDNTIKVTRVAGTSAGSIVGALFAARIPMKKFRLKLLAVGPSLAKQYRFKGKVHAIATILWGKSLWKQTQISTLLQELLADSEKGSAIELGQMNPLMLITTSNLHTQKLHRLRDTEQAVDSMLHSAAIPFAFRSHKEIWFVDGGICENLPSSLLLPDVKTYGPVLALSFQAEFVDAGRKKSLFEYCKSLLLAAMNNSVTRAKEQLGASCIELNTNLTTFDFAKALDFLRHEEKAVGEVSAQTLDPPNEQCVSFGEVQRKTKLQILKWVELTRNARLEASAVTDRSWQTRDSTDPVAIRHRETQRMLAHMYREQHADQPVIYRKLQLRVTAHSLDPRVPGRRDEFTMISVIDTKSEPCFCHKVTLIDANHDNSITSTDIEVLDKNGVRLEKSVQMPIDDDTTQVTREVLIFFIPPLRPDNGPYTVKYRSEAEDILKPLRTSGVDELFLFGTRPSEGIEHASVVLVMPKAFGEVKLSAKAGEIMSSEELATIQDSVPFGYQARGFKVRDFPPENRFTVDIKRA
jgi:NTE family protein